MSDEQPKKAKRLSTDRVRSGGDVKPAESDTRPRATSAETSGKTVTG